MKNFILSLATVFALSGVAVAAEPAKPANAKVEKKETAKKVSEKRAAEAKKAEAKK